MLALGDELGITEALVARPVQAAFASAGSFAVGAALPLLMVLWLPLAALMPGVAGSSLLLLALLGLVAVLFAGLPLGSRALGRLIATASAKG